MLGYYFIRFLLLKGLIMIKIFETHAHYDDEAFDVDRDELLKSFNDNGIYAAVNIGANLESSYIGDKYTKEYDFMYATVGVHPSDIREMENCDGIKILRDLATNNKKIVAIGEIGLDYHYEDTDKPLQKKWFINQLDLARELKLPVVIHSRDAAKDTIDIMQEQKANELGGVVHCYSYTKESAKTFLDMDFFFGIGGVITFSNAKKLKEAVEYIPLDKIVLETDSPYLAPVPFRGKRNSSLYIPYIAEAIAEIKGIDVDTVYEATWNNAKTLYRL